MLEKHAEQMQKKWLYSDSLLCVQFKGNSPDLALKGLNEEMKTRNHFFLFCNLRAYNSKILRGCMGIFLHQRLSVIILDQSPFAECCNGSCWVQDSAGWLPGFYDAAWSQWTERFHLCCRCLEIMDEIIPTHPQRQAERRKQRAQTHPYKCVERVQTHAHTHMQTQWGELPWFNMCLCG